MKKLYASSFSRPATQVESRDPRHPITIRISDYISARGSFVRHLPDGRIVVRDGQKEFAGREIATA